MDRTIRARAHRLRRRMTPAEVALWQRLRRAALGARFRRQHPIGPFIVDFLSQEARLAVELDGQPHFDDYSDYQLRRTEFLEAKGYRMLRFENREIYEDLDGVVEEIRSALGAGSR